MPSLNRTSKPFSLAAICLFALFFLSGCASREERISQALNKADLARQKNELDNALSILGKAAMKIPDSAALHEAIANTRLESNDPQDAVSAFAKSIELDPNRQRLWIRIADIRDKLGETELAANALENYLESFPDDFLAWKNYASLKERLDDSDGAIKATLEWNRIRPSAAPALKLGELFQQSGNFAQARSWISQAAAYVRDQGAQDALAALIELEISLQQYLPASTWLDQYDSRYGTGSADPRIVSARETIGKWRQAQKEIAEAAARLEEKRLELERQALETSRRAEADRLEQEALLAEQERIAAEALANAQSDIEVSDSEEILPAIDDATDPFNDDQTPAIPPADDTDYLAQARDAAANGETNASIELYWRALGPNSGNPDLWYELSGLYMETRNWLDAEACILEAKRRAPRSAPIAARYLSIVAQTQALARVVQEAQALINLFPGEAALPLNLARALRKANAPRSRVTDAYEEFLNKATASDEGFAEATQFVQGGL